MPVRRIEVITGEIELWTWGLVHWPRHMIHNGPPPCDFIGMAQPVSIIVGSENRARLAAVLGDRNRPQKHVQRVNIILLPAARLPVLDVARRAGVSRPAVWRWQVRYAEQGIDGLLRDETRKPSRASLPTATVAKVLALTCSEPPGAVTHWTGRVVAKAVGISLRAVQRI